MGVRPFAQLAPYFEAAATAASIRSEPRADRRTATAERVDDQNQLVLSVAVPIQRFRAIYGVLSSPPKAATSTTSCARNASPCSEFPGGVRGDAVHSSLYLAGTIAEPVRRLAAAADRVRSGRGGREDIPRLPERNDEIGDLADSLSAMTQALYDRIDAIESFAADVAHELKNPLTSLKSAVEPQRAPGRTADLVDLCGRQRNRLWLASCARYWRGQRLRRRNHKFLRH